MMPDLVENLYVTTIPGYLRISIEGRSFDRPMTPTAMRILAVALQQAALEEETNMQFLKPANT